ncbi:MAG: hypothetical protein ACKOA8_08345, partial [Deltaproteobacteria bacterium]
FSDLPVPFPLPVPVPRGENGKVSNRCFDVTVADKFPQPGTNLVGTIIYVGGWAILITSVVAACASAGTLSPFAGAAVGVALVYIGNGTYVNRATGEAFNAKECGSAFCSLIGDDNRF